MVQGKANSSLLNEEEQGNYRSWISIAKTFWREGKEIQYDWHGEVPTHTIGIIGEQGELESLLCSLHSIICPFKNIEPPSVHQTLCLDPGRHFTNIPLRGRASAVVAHGVNRKLKIIYKEWAGFTYLTINYG